ncbi:MAG: hypothetical protein ACFCU5_17625 [Pleurocapsa sp.]
MSFKSVQVNFPYPQQAYSYSHLRETFTGKGKSIIVDTIKKNNFQNLLEVGSFLGASIDFWFNSCSDLSIVSVDPLLGGWAGSHCKNLRYNEHCLLDISEENVNYLNSDDGLYRTFLKNMYEYRNKLVLIREKIETAVPQLQQLNFQPDIIFLDANKSYELLEYLYNAFPHAILSGDDYRWKNQEQVEIMQQNVHLFAQKYDRGVYSKLDSWIII